MLRAENFDDLMTTDHKVLSEVCESRINHLYAIVVQDLATQWIQSNPCKTKKILVNGKEFTEVSRAVGQAESFFSESLQKFLEPTRTPEVAETDNSLE